MNMPKLSAILLSLLLAACAHAPQQIVEPVAKTEQEPEPAPQTVTEKPLNLPKMELNGQMLYEFLLGEVATQRGNQELATQVYMDLANSTLDPRVARRAAQLAFDSRQMDRAVEALNLWLKLEPESHQAKQLLITALLTGGRLEEARPYLTDMLATYPDKAGHTFMQTYPLFARYPDKGAVLSLFRELAQPFPNVAEAHWAMAQAAGAADQRELALQEARKARSLNPEWEMAVLLEAQLLQRDAPQQALDVLKAYLAAYPWAGDARLLYARMLLEQKQYIASRAEFLRLMEAHPENADLAFASAMLSLQIGDLEQAEIGLRQALEKGRKDEDTVFYYLGQLNESKKNDEEALRNYRQVQNGEYLYAARLRVAQLLNKMGKLEEARDYLHQTDAQNNQQRVQLLSIEAQILREAKQPGTAYQVLAQGLEKLPNHPDLLYETAMLADQVGKHDIFEQLMRKAIEAKPDYAQAYNALGYSLLDRNERLEEGMQLVEKAIQLAPDDAAIMDSVGWGHYRQGNLPKSLEFLRRAYAVIADPEIAAHLGEVLWMQGEKEEAQQVWNDTLKAHPDNAILQAVIKKFIP